MRFDESNLLGTVQNMLPKAAAPCLLCPLKSELGTLPLLVVRRPCKVDLKDTGKRPTSVSTIVVLNRQIVTADCTHVHIHIMSPRVAKQLLSTNRMARGFTYARR